MTTILSQFTVTVENVMELGGSGNPALKLIAEGAKEPEKAVSITCIAVIVGTAHKLYFILFDRASARSFLKYTEIKTKVKSQSVKNKIV